MKYFLTGLCLLSTISAFAGITCDDLAQKDYYMEFADKAKSNDEFLSILREGRETALRCNFTDKVQHYDGIIQNFSGPAAQKQQISQSKMLIECAFRENNKNETIYLDAEESDGAVRALGNYSGVKIELNYNNQKPELGRTLQVYSDSMRINQSLEPGLGPIKCETSAETRMWGVKRELRVECFPKRQKFVRETHFE
jgi:hypothetical protein